MRIVLIASLLLSLAACTKEAPRWELKKSVSLGNMTPIGLVVNEDEIWLSDGDHNRLVRIDSTGKELAAYEEMERPMHIAMDKGVLYIPEYGSDTIRVLRDGIFSSAEVMDTLDAPGGVDVRDSEMAIADFYSHRVFYYDGNDRIVLGGEGQEEGQFYYPTDVQLTEDRIWVADAYNNRVQSFNKQGQFVQAYGELDDINAATGIYVNDTELFVTDFENSRILVFDMEGTLTQEITEEIEKPTDMVVKDGELWVANYKGKSISIYSK